MYKRQLPSAPELKRIEVERPEGLQTVDPGLETSPDAEPKGSEEPKKPSTDPDAAESPNPDATNEPPAEGAEPDQSDSQAEQANDAEESQTNE